MKPRIETDLTLFLVYRFLSTSYLFAPFLMLFFGGRGLSVTEITLLNTVYCVTAMLFEVPTGALADRFGRKWAMVLGSVMMAAGCLLDYRGHSFAVFALGEGLLALGMTLTSGADSAYLFDLLDSAGRGAEYRRREGVASAAKLIGTALAFGLGGWLAVRSVAATYLATAVVCLAAALVAACLHEASYRPRASRPMVTQILSSCREVADHPPLAFAIAFSMLVFTLVRMGIFLHQPLLSEAGFSLSDIGLGLGALALVAAVGSHQIEMVRRVLGERVLVGLLPFLLVVSYLALGYPTLALAAIGLQYLVNGVNTPLAKELLNREIADSGKRATILSVDSMVRRLAFGLLAPFVGLAVDHGGLHEGLQVCTSLAAFGAAWLGWRMVRRHRERVAAFEGERELTPLPEFERELGQRGPRAA